MYSGAPYSVSPEIGRRLKNGGRGKSIHAQITRRNQGELNRPVPLYANLSHKAIRTSRIAVCESFASLEGNASPRPEGDVPYARRETFPSFGGSSSHRSKGTLPLARREQFVSLGSDMPVCCLSLGKPTDTR